MSRVEARRSLRVARCSLPVTAAVLAREAPLLRGRSKTWLHVPFLKMI